MALGDKLFKWEGWEAQAEIRKEPAKLSMTARGECQEYG